MDFFKVLLIAHITGGGLSLLIGTVVLFLKKGTRLHKLLGNIFYYGLLLSSLVALPMSYLHTNYFLFIIGVFTAYMLVSGRRYMVTKGKPQWQDWALTGIMFSFALAFLGLSAYQFFWGNMMGTVLLVFGSLSLLFVYQDWTNFTDRSVGINAYLTTHLQRMAGSYIASVTAFLVVNNTILPPVIAWLLPTVVVTPLIIRWSRKHKLLRV